jgi:hypothetical protein
MDYSVGCRIRVRLYSGKIVEAEITAITNQSTGRKIQSCTTTSAPRSIPPRLPKFSGSSLPTANILSPFLKFPENHLLAAFAVSGVSLENGLGRNFSRFSSRLRGKIRIEPKAMLVERRGNGTSHGKSPENQLSAESRASCWRWRVYFFWAVPPHITGGWARSRSS